MFDAKLAKNSKKVSQPIKVVSVEPDAYSRELNEAFGSLVELVIPFPYKNQQVTNENFGNFFTEETEALLPFMIWSYSDDETPPEDRPPYSDICFVVEDARFYCHKVFMCGRSDYFKALLIDHFSETVLPDIMEHDSYEESVPEVTLRDVSAEDFAAIVAYIYQDTTHVKVQNLYSVLCAADLYLLNGLKRLCANQIKDHLDVDNVIPILKTARLFSLEGLESNCVMFLAKCLEKFIDDTEFHELIVEDAATIENREEKDSIPVIDEIRFHLMKNLLPVSISPECNVYDSDIKLALLDQLLKNLDLEC
ncbi:Ankyrin repeat and BTB/POZ domain-containing protein 1 [Exaiptasia diaphana]|nr:Ankyrin repeat and BTB/POZ domain-containing protein 1 [Exaiptasia diaphana]